MPTFSIFFLLTLPWLFPHTPIPGRQILIKWNQKMKIAFLLKELAPTPLLLLPSINIKRPSLVLFLVFFPFICGIKYLFAKPFDFNCWLLVNDCSRKEVDPSFASCQYLQAIKANKTWQLELLNSKIVYMIELILLAIAIFWDLSFTLCPRHTLNLV